MSASLTPRGAIEADAWREIAQRLDCGNGRGYLCLQVDNLLEDDLITPQMHEAMRARIHVHLGGESTLTNTIIEESGDDERVSWYDERVSWYDETDQLRVLAALFLACECESDALPSPRLPGEERT